MKTTESKWKHFSEWTEVRTIPRKRPDEEIRQLWEAFSAIPIDEEENIEEDFELWKTGTSRQEIWHWFDENYSKGLGVLMYE